MGASVFSATRCRLGEGPLWHPLREQLFWFDILGRRLLTRVDQQETYWQFEDCVSAAGWVDRDTLLMASAKGLWRFSIETGQRDLIQPLEAEENRTRSNDGRADPWGGFWIGTMGYQAEPGLGAIYRFYRGEVRRLFDGVTISNAICFAPDRSCAYFADTAKGQILRQPLAPQDGWPLGAPELFLDLSTGDFGVDGAVVDAAGNLWNAQWGAGRVACYSPEGALLETVSIPTPQASCPAFGGQDLDRLYITSASEDDLPAPAGQTFVARVGARGQREHQVIL